MKHLFFPLLFIFLIVSRVNAQNPAVILAPNYIPNISLNQNPIPLPTFGPNDDEPLTGYDGQKANYSQNIQVNQDGEIMFFIVDAFIYDRNGKMIDGITEFDENYGDIPGFMGEVVVVPIPNETNCTAEYYIFTSKIESGGNLIGGRPYFSKLRIEYDLNDELLPTSGLQLINFNNFDYQALNLADFAGTEYAENSENHYGSASFAAMRKNSLNEYFIFVYDDITLHTFNLNTLGELSYFGGLNFNDFDLSISLSDSETEKKELEVIALPNGNYRVGMIIQAYSNPGSLKGIYIIDLDQNGNFIMGTNKFAKYIEIPQSNDAILIKGFEFSPNGDKLYISHTKTSYYNNVLDYFDLTQTNLERSVIDIAGVNEDDYEYSQIEKGMPIIDANNIPHGTILIPANNRLSRIKNADNPTFLTDFESNYLTLTNYLSVSDNPNNEDYRIRLMQDQLDNLDYSTITNSEYDKFSYTASTSATWSPNTISNPDNNPITTTTSNTVYIHDELRIPNDVTITISNMNFIFAPEAKVVVEQFGGNTFSRGGTLILDHSTFTVDTRCVNDLWQGVEILGDVSRPQGTVTNSKQGIFILQNNSKIEYARIGANAFDGGIVQSFSSTFSNNPIGVQLGEYYSNSSISKFEKTTFVWEAIENSLPITFNVDAHVRMKGLSDVSFRGCKFKNNKTLPDLNSLSYGVGIHATNTLFYVDWFCNSPDCNFSQFPSEFQNLSRGIQVDNFNNDMFIVDHSKFNNCFAGIIANNAQNEIIIRNHFYIREKSHVQTVGINLNNSTGYTVEGNTLTNFDDVNVSMSSANAYGIVVRNSGESHNEIYRNTFSNLKYGGRSEGLNGKIEPNENDIVTKGLQWKCNTFNNTILIADLSVFKGFMDYTQGYQFSGIIDGEPVYPARNVFSPNPNPFTNLEHHILLRNSKDINYIYYANPNQVPLYYTNNIDISNGGKVYPSVKLSNTSPQPMYAPYNSCPSNYPTNIILDPSDPESDPDNDPNGLTIEQIKYKVEELSTKIKTGDSEELYVKVKTQSNVNALLQELLIVSPYLSNRILLAYIDRNPSVGILKQVLIANSTLTKEVKAKVDALSLNNGIRNLINAAQVGLSPLESIHSELSYYEDLLYNKKDKEFAATYANPETRDLAINFLEISEDLNDKKRLMDIHLMKKNQLKIDETKQILITKGASTDYMEMVRIKDKIKNHKSVKEAIETNDVQPIELENIVNFTEDIEAKSIAQTTLNVYINSIEFEPFEELVPLGSSAKMIQEQEQILDSKENVFLASIFPNPTSGKFNIYLPDSEKGELEIQIVDLSGKMVYNKHFQQSNHEIIDLQDATKGLYLVKILIDKQIIEVQKLELK